MGRPGALRHSSGRILAIMALLLAASVSAVEAPVQPTAWVPHYDGPWSFTFISDKEQTLDDRTLTLDDQNADLMIVDEGTHIYLEAKSRTDDPDNRNDFEITIKGTSGTAPLREGFWPFDAPYAPTVGGFPDYTGTVFLSRNGFECPAEHTHADIRRLHRTDGVIDEVWVLWERQCRGFGTALFG